MIAYLSLNEMIPKIVHYCWFGNKDIPALESKCLATRKNVLHDYKLKQWNEIA